MNNNMHLFAGGDVACAFSVICDPKRRGDEKTLDLIAPSKEVRNVWAVAVEAVLVSFILSFLCAADFFFLTLSL